MHSTFIDWFIFKHNGDYSGDVTIAHKGTGAQISIPCDVLKRFIANWVREERISELEYTTPDEILRA